MKTSLKHLALATLLAAATAATSGCTTYSISGAHNTPAQQVWRGNAFNPQPYRLSFFACEIPSKVTRENIENALMAKNSHRFGRTSNPADATIFDVRIAKPVTEDNSGVGFAVYFLSLGVLPGNIISGVGRSEVSVSVYEKNNALTNIKGGLKYRTNVWLSVWTPLALFCSDNVEDYTERRTSAGVMLSGNLEKDSNDVFINTIVAEIDALIDRYEATQAPRK